MNEDGNSTREFIKLSLNRAGHNVGTFSQSLSHTLLLSPPAGFSFTKSDNVREKSLDSLLLREEKMASVGRASNKSERPPSSSISSSSSQKNNGGASARTRASVANSRRSVTPTSRTRSLPLDFDTGFPLYQFIYVCAYRCLWIWP